MTHGVSWFVMKVAYGDIIGNAGPAFGGNSVFIGINTIILRGAKLGNNIIVGSNTSVSGGFPDNCVIRGNQERAIYSFEENKKKRGYRVVDEMKRTPQMHYSKYHKSATENILFEYLGICENKKEHLNPLCMGTLGRCHGSKDKTIEKFKTHKLIYENCDELLRVCEVTYNE